MPQSLNGVVGRLQELVGNQNNRDLQPRLELGDVSSFLVEKEAGHLHGHLNMHGRGVVLHRLFLKDAQNVECTGVDVANDAGAVATGAGDVRALVEGWPQALPGEFHEAKPRDLAHLHPGPVVVECIPQALLDIALSPAGFHVDEVDDDQAAKVPQTQLPSNLISSL